MKRKHEFSAVMAKQYGVTMPGTQDDSEKYLTPNDIGKILGVTGEAVKQWIYHRRLPAVKLVNGYWKVKVADFERFLEARHQQQRIRVFVEASEEIRNAIAAEYEVMTASNVCDALIKLSQEIPSVLVLDVASRAVPALRLLKQKQKIKGLHKRPAIVIGELADADLDSAMELGVVAAVNDLNGVLKELRTALIR